MKKIVAFILLTCMVLSFTACGKVEVTMQEVYNAGKNENLIKNHQSVHVVDETDGVVHTESYLTKDYIFFEYPDADWAEFFIKDAYYDYFEGEYSRAFIIHPDGVKDIVHFCEKNYESILFSPETVHETIESATKKDGRITLKTFFDKEAIDNILEIPLTSCNYEYVLDEKTLEMISFSGDMQFEDGSAYSVISKISYDVQAPERVNTFLQYVGSTQENRNITVVNNPLSEEEISQTVQSQKGLPVVFASYGYYEKDFEVYTDAECTQLYDASTDTESDLTVYVKWTSN